MNNKNVKTISVILEGGAGDWICGARFIPSIKKAYPNAELICYSNTDGNEFQEKLINTLWPSYFKETHQVSRISQDHFETSQFGREKFNAAYRNISEDDRRKIESADLVRYLHVDGLNWLDYPECHEAFYIYPKAEAEPSYNFNLPEKFVLAHLFARPDSDRKLEDFYVKRLVKDLAAKIPVVIPVEEKYLSYYDFCKGWENVMVIPTDLYETWWLAQNCSAFIGVDSAIRYFSLCRPEIPNFVFNKFANQPFQAPAFQSIRWCPNSKSCFPLNFDSGFVVKTLVSCMDNYANYLYPEFLLSGQDINQGIVRRIFT